MSLTRNASSRRRLPSLLTSAPTKPPHVGAYGGVGDYRVRTARQRTHRYRARARGGGAARSHARLNR